MKDESKLDGTDANSNSESDKQTFCLTIGNSAQLEIECFHIGVLATVLVTTFFKIVLIQSNVYFIKLTSFGLTLSSLELFPISPRILSLFTSAIFACSEYTGISALDKKQYILLRIAPFSIGLMHTLILLIKRQMILTVDDIIWFILYVPSILLCLSCERKFLMYLSKTSNDDDKNTKEKDGAKLLVQFSEIQA